MFFLMVEEQDREYFVNTGEGDNSSSDDSV